MLMVIQCNSDLASLRYIFMILPLFLVLVPEASSDMTEIRNDYENILYNMINHLVGSIFLFAFKTKLLYFFTRQF